MSARICIYCREVSNRLFPKEHVLPKAFGRFHHNLTLDCVCERCNRFFGGALELFLARDSVEALLRARYGLKTNTGHRKIGSFRLHVRVISPGDWYSAQVKIETDSTGNACKAEPLLQVAFRKRGDQEWKWFAEKEISAEAVEPYRVDAETKVVGPPGDAVERLMDKIADLGVHFKKREAIERHTRSVEVYAESILDAVIFRAVGKIAFNFLTFIKGAEFALRADFNPIRNFIRYGEMPSRPPIIVTKNAILQGDDAFYRQTDGHIIVLDWDKFHTGVICLVSLFNHLTYHVSLCDNYSGVWHPLSAGRHFDTRTLTISEVRGM